MLCSAQDKVFLRRVHPAKGNLSSGSHPRPSSRGVKISPSSSPQSTTGLHFIHPRSHAVYLSPRLPRLHMCSPSSLSELTGEAEAMVGSRQGKENSLVAMNNALTMYEGNARAPGHGATHEDDWRRCRTHGQLESACSRGRLGVRPCWCEGRRRCAHTH